MTLTLAIATIAALIAAPLVGRLIADWVARIETAEWAAEIVSAEGASRPAPFGSAWPRVALSAAAVVVAAWAVAAAPGWHALAGVALGWTLLALSAVDLRFMILPDVLTLPLIPAGIAVATLSSGTDATAHAIGAAVGGGVLFVFAESYRLLRGRDGLGLGDAKLFAAAGAWVGWSALPSVLLIAAASGLAAALVLAALRRRNGGVAARPLAEFALPFGPFLGVGLWLTWLYGPLEFAWV